MASLAGLTSRVAGAPGRLVAGTAGNIYSAVKGAVVQGTGISALRPTNIAAAVLEKSGLGPFVPSLASAFAGGGGGLGKTISNVMPDMAGAGAPGPQQAPANDNQTQTSILAKILSVDTSILEIAQKDTKNLDSLTTYMKDLLNFMRGDSLKRQEESREARIAKAAQPSEAGKAAPAKAAAGGGILGGLLNLIPGFGLVKSVLSGITDAFSTIVKFGGILLRGLLGIGRFLIRFAGPVGAVIGVLLSLETQDWGKFFARFTSAIADFIDGKWLDGALKVLLAVPELILKGIGRITARILEFFGFENAAKAIDDFINDFDLVELVKNMFNYVKETFINIKDTVVNFFTDAKNKIAEWWNSFSIIDPIVYTFNFVKESVVNAFTTVKDKVAEWFTSAADLGSKIGEGLGDMTNKVWEFFKSLPGKLVDAASNLVPDFIKEPFRKLFGTAPATQAAPTPTPQAAPTAPATPTQTPSTAPSVRSTTPVMPSTDVEIQRYAGKTKEQIMEEILPLTGGNPYQAETEAERIYAKVKNIPVPATSTTPTPVQPVLSQRENVFNDQSSRQAVEQSTTPSQPVIINNTTSNATNAGNGATNTRMGGAVSTSPRDSHIDRALYGNVYGAGVP